jgi:hypothetical protein
MVSKGGRQRQGQNPAGAHSAPDNTFDAVFRDNRLIAMSKT